MLVDIKTGDIEHLIVPISGQKTYLRAFMDGSIHWPEGSDWEKYRIQKSDDIEELYDIYRYYPILTHGHESLSPDRNFLAQDGGKAEMFIIKNAPEVVQSWQVSRDSDNYHLHWIKNPRFFIGWVRGWRWREGIINVPEYANVVFQLFTDGTLQPVFNTHHKPNTYYDGGDFSMQSPDATKIHTASSMTGRFRNYVAVMARPRPPQNLKWEAKDSSVLLTWEPSEYSRETRGYLVYRSENSGDGYELMTDEPVEANYWRDQTVEPGKDYYYVVSSLEFSGLESGYSSEITRAGVALPDVLEESVNIYLEAEESIRDLHTLDYTGLALGRDVAEASDWYYIYKHPGSEIGRSLLAVDLPVEERYHLWARIRSDNGEQVRWDFEAGGSILQAESDAKQWTWVYAGAVVLSSDRHELAFLTSDANAELDLIFLSSDANFQPSGKRPENRQLPAAPENLNAENIKERVNHLKWTGPEHIGISHFNVYASRDPITEITEEKLLGSPTEPEFIDWGLQAETDYFYAITAVDRQRNESNPVFEEVSTPSREVPEHKMELSFAKGETEGDFERVDEAGGLLGPGFVIPEEPDKNRINWRVKIPEESGYYFWLRYRIIYNLRGVMQNCSIIGDGKRTVETYIARRSTGSF